MNWPPSPAVRLWIYGVLIAGVPLLIWYGILSKEVAPLWVALVAAMLGPGLASFNVPRKEIEK